MTDITHKPDLDLDATIDAYNDALAIATELASSPSQNMPKRREVEVFLTTAAKRLDIFVQKLEPFKWEEEKLKFKVPADGNRNLATQVVEKNLSWAGIKSSIETLQDTLSKAKIDLIFRVKKDSEDLVKQVDHEISAFAPAEKQLTDEDWSYIAKTVQLANTNSNKCEAFPLALEEPWRAKREINTLLSKFDSTIAEKSGTVANNVESVTRSLGFEQHKGRKLTFMAMKYKWIILGTLIAMALFKK